MNSNSLDQQEFPLPIIFMDPKIERDIILREIYYTPSGYYRSAQKFYEEVKKTRIRL